MFKKIVVGVDFTPRSERAVGVALDLARAVKATVVVVHVISVGAEVRGASTSQPAVRPTIEKRLAEYAEGLSRGTGLTVEYGVVDGDEAGELVRYADLWGGDLLVLGSEGRSPVQQVVLGSVAGSVVHRAHVPVLVVGPQARV